MTFLDIFTFFAVTTIAAIINSVAGGGTFLTFPVFIMAGLSPLQANVMSTIALWPGTIASSYGYRKELVVERKLLWQLLLVCVLGGTAGAFTLLHTPEIVFKRLVPWLLLAATLIFTFGRYGIVWLHNNFPKAKNHQWLGVLLQVFISFYGGYFGAGIGILMLAMLQLMGYSNIHQMNALKTLLAATVGVATVAIFLFSNIIVWNIAAVMIVGGLFGGYAGARMALKISPQRVRLLVSCIGFFMTAYFFLSDV